MELRFVASESTFAYFETLKSYLQHHGKPVAFYSDKHSIFRVSRENAASGDKEDGPLWDPQVRSALCPYYPQHQTFAVGRDRSVSCQYRAIVQAAREVGIRG